MNHQLASKGTILLLLLGVIGVGVYFYQEEQQNSGEYALTSESEEAEDNEALPGSILGTNWVDLSSLEENGQPLSLYENASHGVRFYYPEHWGTIKFIGVTDYDLLYVDHPRITEEVDTIVYPSDNSVADEGVPWRWLSFQEANVFSGFGDRWLRWGRYFTEENESDYCSALLTAKYPLETTGSQAMTHCESFQNDAGHWVTHLYMEETQKRYNVYLIRFPDDRYQSVAMTDLYLSEPFGKEVAYELAALVRTLDFLDKPPPYVPVVTYEEKVVWEGDRYQRIATQEFTDGYPSWCYTKVALIDKQTGEAVALPESLESNMRCYGFPYSMTPDETNYLYFEWNGYDQDMPLQLFNIETGDITTVMSLKSDAEIGIYGGFAWNPSGNRVAFVITKGVSDDYPYGSKIFTFDWGNGQLSNKQKFDAKVKVLFSDQGYSPLEFGFLDDDTIQYRAWTEDFYEWDEWDSFLDDDEALAQEPVYETVEL